MFAKADDAMCAVGKLPSGSPPSVNVGGVEGDGVWTWQQRGTIWFSDGPSQYGGVARSSMDGVWPGRAASAVGGSGPMWCGEGSGGSSTRCGIGRMPCASALHWLATTRAR